MSHKHIVKRCVTSRIPMITTTKRKVSSGGGSNTLDKMQTKSVVILQWKLLNQLKDYLSKFSTDKTFSNVLNKEFAHFLQKIQPSVYGTDLIRYFESFSVPTALVKNTKSSTNDAVTTSGIVSVLNGLKLRVSLEETKTPVLPKWKETKVIVSKESVVSRTTHILSSLAESESDNSVWCRIEDLNAHLIKYPEAQHSAVKEGAIRLLLKTQETSTNVEIKRASNESLALLGYAAPVKGPGVRILSIDGGGVRGILVLEMMKKLEELTGKSIYEMFDMICGVSTGAIITTLIGGKQNTLDEIHEIYADLSRQIFTQSTLKGTSNLVWSHSYYDTAQWERMLKEQISDATLISTARNLNGPKMCSVSAVVNQSRLSAYVFRNYNLPCRVQSQYLGSHKHQIWESVRASAAAPTYFEEFRLGSYLHQDGGILFNNPTAVAIHEAKLLWPTTPIQCVVSFGTGRTIPVPVDPNSCESLVASSSSWKSKFYAIIDSATDTEGVHTMLCDLLPGNVYYRFNPYLTEMLDIAEIEPGKLEQLKRDAVMYLRRNEDKFQDAAKVLSLEKSFGQKTSEWMAIQAQIHGLSVAN